MLCVAALTEIAVLREQLTWKESELDAVRADLARFLQPTSASKDDGDDTEQDRDAQHRQVAIYIIQTDAADCDTLLWM